MEKNIQRMRRGVVSVLMASMTLGIGILSFNVFEKNDEIESLKKDISRQSGIIEKHEGTIGDYQATMSKMERVNGELVAQKKKLTLDIKKLEIREKKKDIEIEELKKKIKANQLKAEQDLVKQETQNSKKSKSAKINNSVSTQQFNMTSYVSNCKGCSGTTSTGIDVKNTIYHNGMRVVSTDRNVIPMGSILEISVGGNTFKAQALDVGGAIKGNKMDLLVSSKSEAMEFGRKTATVKIVRRGW